MLDFVFGLNRMNIVFVFLGLLDTISGVLILYPALAGDFLVYFAFYSLFKGFFSVLSSFAIGYYTDWMGAVDIITGSVLALLSFGFLSFGFSLSYVLCALAVLKGLYCFISAFYM